jgi:hypothetical protein
MRMLPPREIGLETSQLGLREWECVRRKAEGRARSMREGSYARRGNRSECVVGQRKLGKEEGELR